MFRKSQIAALLAVLSVVQITSAADDASTVVAKDWKLLGSGSEVMSGTGYCFRNNALGQSIRYGKRGSLGGINLVWDKSATLTGTHFQNQAGQGPIKYGEKIALKIDGPSTPYVRYEKRTIGINLGWSGKPVFEWVIVGGTEGQAVRVGEAFALINTVEGDFLVYAKRGGEAINLRWYLDRNKGDYSDQAKRIVMKEGFNYAKAYLMSK